MAVKVCVSNLLIRRVLTGFGKRGFSRLAHVIIGRNLKLLSAEFSSIQPKCFLFTNL